ncbi:nicotinate phosphoribosyltransferase [Candidatus Bathyarchaeota archaeon]|nr:nicotinate phosphoribosyltransferase [Candidatus Bathyarchaeota archaeon]
MAQSYLENGKTKPAVFSLFVRRLPKNRSFLVAAGLETLLKEIKNFKFKEEELKYLENLNIFSKNFLSYLESYKFSGDIYAINEGRIIFENEPLIQVEASLPEAQILETLIINIIHFQTLIASKAARSFIVSGGKRVIDFGFRRAHGIEAGVYAARAAYIAGIDSTSNLEAGKQFGIPVVGTMAHSYVMVFDFEEEAFKCFAKSFPKIPIFLIDTYDTLLAAKKVVKLAKEGIKAIAVRIDSGDLINLSRKVREILDSAGLTDVKIIVSGGLDEYDIKRLMDEKAPVDTFAVGTKVVTSADQPYLDIAYKLVEYDGKPKSKLSPGKATFPYKRQVVRYYLQNGIMNYDESVKFNEEVKGEKLVFKVVEKGEIIYPFKTLKEIRKVFLEDVKKLPENLKTLDSPTQKYKVVIK